MDYKKVIVTSTSFAKNDSEPIQLLKKHNWEVIFRKGPFRDEQLASVIQDADAIIVGIDQVGPKTIAAGKRLKIVAKHGTGIDNIDLSAAKKAGIRVVNVPHTNAIAVAEYVFSGIFHLVRSLSEACASLKNGNWEGSKFIGTELDDKVLGIIGFGHIGQKTAQIGKGFGMEVLYYDVQRNYEVEKVLGATFTPLDQLLSKADFITLHVPLTPETKNMIGAEEFAKMKSTAIIVNVARGGVVSEPELYQALVEGKVGGAVLDVFEVEPTPNKFPFLGLENVVCTPHLAGYTLESLNRTSLSVAQKLVNEFSVEKPNKQ